MKIKKYEPVNYIPVKEKRNLTIAFIIAIILVILLNLSIIIKLSIESVKLTIQNQELNKVIQMKDSMIADVQEDNIKLQEMINSVKNKR